MKINNPKVRTFIGNVRINKIGRINMLSSDKMTAAIIAAYGPANEIPGMNSPTINSVSAVSNNRVMITIPTG